MCFQTIRSWTGWLLGTTRALSAVQQWLKPAHELRRMLGLRDVETLRGVDISVEEFGNVINVVNGEEGDEEAPEYDAARICGIGNPLFMAEERKENTETVEAQCCGCRRLHCCIIFGVILVSFAIVAAIITLPLWIVPCVLLLVICVVVFGGNPHQQHRCRR